ncbi:DUF2125 domain-containing protein [Pseudodonghicola flavimaris]|uniref:DUF2125 domain-containing protein n=1 Tax=Pseudodonghicola flavimaris TaxID=3050036 RepID=A0ABT7EYL5_9RHOB|nr:DUF2125 domain-containing protein [Pseudodonghicola flavimaris]MDK3017419.1 DUF2125 domain-containing protein [Pseudodonghicola flavimaris]
MRRLIKIAIVLGLLWSGVWLAGSLVLKRGIEGWFATQAARGWQAEYAAITGSGYPLRHMTLIDTPALADPGSGAAWRADWLLLDSPAIWPGHQRLQFPATDQRLSFFDRTTVIRAEDMQARLDLRLGRALTLDRLELTAAAWQSDQPDGDRFGADDLILSMRQEGAPESYRLSLAARGFTPGRRLRLGALAGGSGLPGTFDALSAEAQLRFDRPWDRRALEDRRPQPRAIVLDDADIHWGPLRLQARGAVDIDPAGRPGGEIALRAENWREMLMLAEQAGVIPAETAAPLRRVLELLAGTGDDSDTLDTQLRFADGRMSLGPLPLGPAPQITLR